MAYVDPDYKAKKELKQAIESGKELYPYTPNGMFPSPQSGRVTIEGPHYPKPHRWYATVLVENGKVIKFIS